MRFGGLAILLVAACSASHATSVRAPANVEHTAASTQPVSPPALPTAAEVRIARGDLTPDVVLATIKDRYLPGVQRCYARHAKSHASASGRVLVSFTVDDKGKTHGGSAHGIARRVDACITAQLARWTFPAPRAESSFALGLQLAAD